MAVLSDNDRGSVNGLVMSDLSQLREALPLSKADLRAAVNAVDDWIENNQASFNSAIPQPARGALSGVQKVQLLAAVALRRLEVARG